jgi:hypothetical protein
VGVHMHVQVAAYMAFAGDARDMDGHGTHCAGTIAGSSAWPTVGPGDINDFEGMAPEARLVVVDFDGGDGWKWPFGPPGNDTFAMDWARQLGAKVHSCSWGGHRSAHPATCALVLPSQCAVAPVAERCATGLHRRPASCRWL